MVLPELPTQKQEGPDKQTSPKKKELAYDKIMKIIEKGFLFETQVGKKRKEAGIDIDPNYGHLSYSEFPEIYKAGHDAFLGLINLSFEKLEKQYSLRMYVIKIGEMLFYKPLYLKDNLNVYTAIKEIGSTSMTYESCMTKEGKLVSSCEITVVFVDSKTEEPIKIPDEVKAHLQKWVIT